MAIRRKTPAHPLLLVSVRNGREARAALAGGCDILDVKEPNRGSLGFAGDAAIREVLHAAGEFERRVTRIPASAALGEVVDWQNGSYGGLSSEVDRLPRGLTFVKLGLAGLNGQANWESRWSAVRRRFDERAGRPLCWVAVAYADWQEAGSPPPNSIVDTAHGVCDIVLIDTHTKDGRSLFDWMSVDELSQIARRSRRRGMKFAVAGSLQSDHLPALRAATPEIVAIRTAACRGQLRNNPISADAVSAFKAAVAQFRGATRIEHAPRTG